MTTGRIAQLNVSPRGGVPKLPIERTRLGPRGLEGDRQRHTKIHGSPDQAVCLFSVEQIERLRAEGHPIVAGAVGETVTTAGIDLGTLGRGARLRLGAEAVIEITDPAPPCNQIAAAFKDGDSSRIDPEMCPRDARLYARVLVPGDIAAGDPIEVLELVSDGGRAG